ncbi:hypothetical protein K1X84_06075 [bacterium]|nr:hypothetical protein [bacterium]
MKKAVTILSILTLFSVTSASAQIPFANLGFGARAGSNTENGDFFFGGQAYIGISKFTLVPNYEYTAGDDAKFHTINIDGQYEIYGLAVAKMFIGGGYVIQGVKADNRTFGAATAKNPSNKGFNVQIGGKAGLGPIEIFGVAKMIRLDVQNFNETEGTGTSIKFASKAKTTYSLVVGANFSLL